MLFATLAIRNLSKKWRQAKISGLCCGLATSVSGQERRFDRLPATSGLPRITDIARPAWLVRLVPISNIAPAHSITSSARASSDGGTSRPSAFAALRLMTSSNLVGCSTGRFAGDAPFRILSTYSAARRPI